MLAVLGDAATAVAQHGVGLGRAIAAHHLDRFLGADLVADLPDQIQQLRIHVGRLLAAPIPQEPVELFERLVVIAAVALEGDADVLAGVHVVQRERARVALRDDALQALRAEQYEERRKPSALGLRRSSYCSARRACRASSRRATRARSRCTTCTPARTSASPSSATAAMTTRRSKSSTGSCGIGAASSRPTWIRSCWIWSGRSATRSAPRNRSRWCAAIARPRPTPCCATAVAASPNTASIPSAGPWIFTSRGCR